MASANRLRALIPARGRASNPLRPRRQTLGTRREHTDLDGRGGEPGTGRRHARRSAHHRRQPPPGPPRRPGAQSIVGDQSRGSGVGVVAAAQPDGRLVGRVGRHLLESGAGPVRSRGDAHPARGDLGRRGRGVLPRFLERDAVAPVPRLDPRADLPPEVVVALPACQQALRRGRDRAVARSGRHDLGPGLPVAVGSGHGSRAAFRCSDRFFSAHPVPARGAVRQDPVASPDPRGPAGSRRAGVPDQAQRPELRPDGPQVHRGNGHQRPPALSRTSDRDQRLPDLDRRRAVPVDRARPGGDRGIASVPRQLGRSSDHPGGRSPRLHQGRRHPPAGL